MLLCTAFTVSLDVGRIKKILMTIDEYIQFAFFFLFFGVWIVMACLGLFKTDWMIKKSWYMSTWRDLPPKSIKVVNAIFLLAGVLFLVFAIHQLSAGTFKWRSSPKHIAFLIS